MRVSHPPLPGPHTLSLVQGRIEGDRALSMLTKGLGTFWLDNIKKEVIILANYWSSLTPGGQGSVPGSSAPVAALPVCALSNRA